MFTANIKTPAGRKCAFCKHWFDPTSSAIKPKFAQGGVWEFDSKMRKPCLVKNVDTKGIETCARFESKMDSF